MITYQQQIRDTKKLSNLLEDIMTTDTILVNCLPSHSSITHQLLNHYLSKKGDLYETLSMELPTPYQSQVWDGENFVLYDRYLSGWVRGMSSQPHIFICNTTMDGKALQKLKLLCPSAIIAVLYKSSTFQPHYFVEERDDKFEWE